MKNPKAQIWMYLIAGVVAIAGALWFMSIDSSILDWFILALGVVAIVRAFREYQALRRGETPRD